METGNKKGILFMKASVFTSVRSAVLLNAPFCSLHKLETGEFEGAARSQFQSMNSTNSWSS